MKNKKKSNIPMSSIIADELYVRNHLVLSLLVSLPSIIRSNLKNK